MTTTLAFTTTPQVLSKVIANYTKVNFYREPTIFLIKYAVSFLLMVFSNKYMQNVRKH